MLFDKKLPNSINLRLLIELVAGLASEHLFDIKAQSNTKIIIFIFQLLNYINSSQNSIKLKEKVRKSFCCYSFYLQNKKSKEINAQTFLK